MPNSISLKMKGLAGAPALMKKAQTELRKMVAREMYKLGQEIKTESQEFYCPVRTGTLRSSAFVTLPRYEAGVLSLQVGYGGPARNYALPVHENPRAGKTGGVSPSGKALKHWARSGGWKYLEIPFRLKAPELRPRLVKGVATLLK